MQILNSPSIHGSSLSWVLYAVWWLDLESVLGCTLDKGEEHGQVGIIGPTNLFN